MKRILRPLLVLALALSAAALSHARAQSPDPKLNEDLWEAVRRGDAPAVKSLLDRGADANAKGRYQQTPLFKAAERGDVEIVRALIEHGADVKVKDTFYGATPMTWALDKQRVEVVRLLLDKGVPGVEDVLAVGADTGNAELVKVALAKGGLSADALSAALAVATKGSHPEIAELLKAAGAKPPREANFQVDAATLKSYEGTYKPEGGGDLKIAVDKDGKLTVVTPADTFVLAAFDAVTFRPVAFEGVTITFNVEGGKVTGFVFKQGATPRLFKRVETK